jgi:hypothetical protein
MMNIAHLLYKTLRKLLSFKSEVSRSKQNASDTWQTEVSHLGGILWKYTGHSTQTANRSCCHIHNLQVLHFAHFWFGKCHLNMYDIIKGEGVPVHTMNLWNRSRGCQLTTLALDGGVWSSSHPSHFIARERAPVTLWMETGWAQSRSGGFGQEKVSCLCWVIQHIAYSLCWVCYPSPMLLLLKR